MPTLLLQAVQNLVALNTTLQAARGFLRQIFMKVSDVGEMQVSIAAITALVAPQSSLQTFGTGISAAPLVTKFRSTADFPCLLNDLLDGLFHENPFSFALRLKRCGSLSVAAELSQASYCGCGEEETLERFP